MCMQALSLWKRARRDRALTIKAAKLANSPCTSLPSADNYFNLDNNNDVDTKTARERNIGLTNRVLQGMLLHQVGCLSLSLCVCVCVCVLYSLACSCFHWVVGYAVGAT